MPIIKLHGFFYEYEHCEDDVNQGPNNQGPAVSVYYFPIHYLVLLLIHYL